MKYKNIQRIYLTTTLYSCITIFCIIVALTSIFILNFIDLDKLTYNLKNNIMLIWSCIFIYFYYQHIILPITIIAFFTEKFLFNKYIPQKATIDHMNWLIRYQFHICVTSIFIAALTNLWLVQILK